MSKSDSSLLLLLPLYQHLVPHLLSAQNTSPFFFCQQYFCYSLSAFIAGASFPFCFLFLFSVHFVWWSAVSVLFVFSWFTSLFGDCAEAHVLQCFYAVCQAVGVITYLCLCQTSSTALHLHFQIFLPTSGRACCDQHCSALASALLSHSPLF